MIKLSRSIIYVLTIFLFSSPASATLFQVDFYTEMTRTFTVGTDDFFDRTSASGHFLFDDAAIGYEVFPEQTPVIHFMNERFLNGTDISDTIIANDPLMAPQDWLATVDYFHVESSGGVITNFSIQTLWHDNVDLLSMSFSNPIFRVFVNGPRELTGFTILDTNAGATWDIWGPGSPQTTVTWSYTAVTAPATIWLFTFGLLGLTALRSRCLGR